MEKNFQSWGEVHKYLNSFYELALTDVERAKIKKIVSKSIARHGIANSKLIDAVISYKHGYQQRQVSRAVEQFNLETGEILGEYPSLNQAENATGVRADRICKCCKGKISHVYGLGWRYKNE